MKHSSATRFAPLSAVTAGHCAGVRTDDLGCDPDSKALMQRNTQVDWAALDDVYLRLRQPGGRGQSQRRAHGVAAGRSAGFGARRDGQSACAAPAWMRSDARGAGDSQPAKRARDCGRRRKHDACAVRDGQGGQRLSRSAKIEDTTIGWRFVNPSMKEQYGVDAMPETAENVAERVQGQSRADQDAFALRSQQRCATAQAAGFFDRRDRRRSDPAAAKATPKLVAWTSIRALKRRSRRLAKLKGVVKA